MWFELDHGQFGCGFAQKEAFFSGWTENRHQWFSTKMCSRRILLVWASFFLRCIYSPNSHPAHWIGKFLQEPSRHSFCVYQLQGGFGSSGSRKNTSSVNRVCLTGGGKKGTSQRRFASFVNLSSVYQLQTRKKIVLQFQQQGITNDSSVPPSRLRVTYRLTRRAVCFSSWREMRRNGSRLGTNIQRSAISNWSIPSLVRDEIIWK